MLVSAFLSGFGALPAGAGEGRAKGWALQPVAFRQAVAEAARGDAAIAAHYRRTAYAPLWTGTDDAARARRAALIAALRQADILHGLPRRRHDADALLAQMAAVRNARDLGLVEVALSRAFVAYANDVHGGVLEPSRIDRDIDRRPPRLDAGELLSDISGGDPAAYLRGLAPASREYRALVKERLRLKRVIASGGWGDGVPARRGLEPGQSGPAVVALRDRLVRMGYLARSAARSYDAALRRAVRRFQLAHGLNPDGVADRKTLAEINRPPQARLQSVLVAMERERWLGDVRHGLRIVVNQTDFTARLIDRGEVIFETKTVIGKNAEGRRSPEFSDEMELMVVNPSWYVPRSIIVSEYLPRLRRNPNALPQLIITDARGRVVNRSKVDFSRFTARNFPFDMRQPPGARNALGLVKFLFPNRHAVYLHDTPEKHLFGRDLRAFSHGCIRLADPFGFAYKLLEIQQVADPQAYFQALLDSGEETEVPLDRRIPVHLIYRTAFATAQGRIAYRRDVYGRDAKIWKALQQAGVALPAVRG